MPKYLVRLSRDVVESAEIVIEADDEEQAEDRALQRALSFDVTNWELEEDDRNDPRDVYIADIQETDDDDLADE